MKKGARPWRSIICGGILVWASCADPFTPREEEQPIADRYAFCEWRDIERSEELTAADLVGEWIAFWYEIDYGRHTQLTLNEDGTYRELQIPSNGCEAEERCFGSGPDNLCSATETLGSWTFGEGVLRLSERGQDMVLSERAGPDGAIAFSVAENELFLRAASCPPETCSTP